MRSVSETPKFKKQYKKVAKYNNFKKDRFNSAIVTLAQGESLPANYYDHQVKPTSPRELQGLRIFHASPNICVLYKLTPDEVILTHIGSHQDLNLTENIKSKTKIKLRKDLPNSRIH